MIINHNMSALRAANSMSRNSNAKAKSTAKLSSGIQITNASDNAAGLSISEKMRAQIKGLEQSSRNLQDSISLIQTAESGLNEIHSMLQRSRELSVQASNDTLTIKDKESIQDEINQILNEVDNIAVNTEFNTMSLLNHKSTINENGTTNIIKGLKSGWLEKSAELIKTHYGLTPSTRDLEIVIQEGTQGGTLAAVNSSWSVSGDVASLSDIKLIIDRVDFAPSSGADGDNYLTESGLLLYNDRIIAHEMTHAIMADQLGDVYYDLPKWFKEGTAEFIAGADERLKNDVASMGIYDLVDRGVHIAVNASAWDTTPEEMSYNYSVAYLLTKFTSNALKNVGSSMSDFMSELRSGVSFNDAMTLKFGMGGINNIIIQFDVGGEAYYNTLDIQGIGIDENDVGSIAGSDHGGGSLNAPSAVGTGVNNENPTNFNIIFPPHNTSSSITKLQFQIGANSGQTMLLELVDVTREGLSLSGVNLVTNPNEAITIFGNAIETVSTYRSYFGAVQNRLGHAYNANINSAENLTSSESRVRDVDAAKELMENARLGILEQVSQSMLVHAYKQPQHILSLLQ